MKLAHSCVYEASTIPAACLTRIGQFIVSFPSLSSLACSTHIRKPPSVTPLAPQQPGGGGDLPPDPPAPPPEHRPGGWRPVQQRGGGFRRLRKKSGPRPGPVVEAPPPVAPPPERVQTTGSWATWQGTYARFYLLRVVTDMCQ